MYFMIDLLVGLIDFGRTFSVENEVLVEVENQSIYTFF